MKYCPNCGTQLTDDANFCPNCGSKQPNMGNVAQPVIQPVVNNQPQPQVNQVKSPGERYQELAKNDEVFKEIIKVRRKKYLFELIFLVFFIAWLVAMSVPVVLFNGNNAPIDGAQTMAALGKPLPYEANTFDLIMIDAAKGGKALAPGGLSAVFAVCEVIFGIIFSILLAVFPIIKAFTGRGYVLKLYEEGKAQQLIKESTQPYIVGGIMIIATIFGPLNFFLSAVNVEYKAGDTYIFGEIEAIKSGFITICVVVAILAALTIAATIIINNLVTKKLREMAKNL